jgi:hypothetical protein
VDEVNPGFKLRLVEGEALTFLFGVDWDPFESKESEERFISGLVHYTLREAIGKTFSPSPKSLPASTSLPVALKL